MQEGRRPVAIDPRWERRDDAFADVRAQLDEYFDGSRREFDVSLELHGNPFERRVWDALCEIPYGETVSYGEIAREIGAPNAARAVGLANGRNPVAVIVPCHRVIGADGSLTGYGGGLERKRAARPRVGRAAAGHGVTHPPSEVGCETREISAFLIQPLLCFGFRSATVSASDTRSASPRRTPCNALRPLNPPYDPDLARTLTRMMPPGQEPLKLFRTVAHNRHILDKLRSTGSYLLNFGTLDPADRELVIQRTCARCGCEYEWGVHAAVFGAQVGLTGDKLAATVTAAPDDAAAPWTAREALLVALADELHDTAHDLRRHLERAHRALRRGPARGARRARRPVPRGLVHGQRARRRARGRRRAIPRGRGGLTPPDSCLTAAPTNPSAIPSPTPPTGKNRGTSRLADRSSRISVGPVSSTSQVTSNSSGPIRVLHPRELDLARRSLTTDITRLKSLTSGPRATWSLVRTRLGWPSLLASTSTSCTTSGCHDG